VTEQELLHAMIDAFVRPVIEDYPDIRLLSREWDLLPPGVFVVQLGTSKAYREFRADMDLERLRSTFRGLCALEDHGPEVVLKIILGVNRAN
jgi:hypothetical protein